MTAPTRSALIGLVCLASIGLATYRGVLAAPGDVAPLFGGGAPVLLPLLTDDDRGRAVAIQPGGKIVVAGTSFNTAGGTLLDTAVARFLADGSPDPTFAVGGMFVSGGPGDEVINGITVDPTGRIVVVASVNSNDLSVIARLTPDGALDPTFAGGNGFQLFDLGVGPEGLFDVTIFNDGAGPIVAAGFYNDGVSDLATTVCVKGGSGADAGQPCDTFTSAAFALEPGLPATFNSIKAYGATAFVVSGLGQRAAGQAFVVARFGLDGSPDASYGTGGVLEIPLGSGAAEPGESIVQPDGKIVVTGSLGGQVGVFRSTAAGLPDPSFGVGGLVLGPAVTTDHATSLAIQPAGALIVGGYSDAGSLRLFRFTSGGVVDATWGEGGVVTTTLPGGAAQIRDLVIDAEGNVIAAGAGSNGVNDDFLVAKYEGYDLTLNPLVFTPVSGVALSSVVVSAPVAITGLLNPAVAAATDGEYAVSSASNCSGDVRGFGSAPGPVSAGQWVCLRHVSRATNLAPATTTFSLARDVSGTLVPFRSVTFVSTTGPLTITSGNLATFTVLTPQAFLITTVGGPAATIAIAGPVPPGLALTNNGNGTATLSGSPASGTVGSYALTVTASNGTGTDAVQALGLVVQQATQIISFVTPATSPIGTLPLTATASSGLPVSVVSLTPAVCTVTGTTASLLVEGTCRLVAQQAGNADFLPAANVEQSLVVVTNLPGAPVNLTVTVVDAQVTLAWSAAASGPAATHYLVEIGHAPGLTSIISRLVRTTTDSGLMPPGLYYFRVRAVGSAGLSPPSAEIAASVTTAQQVPGPPTAFSAVVSGDTVAISWQPAPFGAAPSQYVLEAGRDYGLSDIGVFPLPAGQTSLLATGVPAGTYVIRARAVTAGNAGLATPEIRLTVGAGPACTVPPALPVMMTPLVTNGRATLTWLGGPSDSFVFSAGTTPGASDTVVVPVGTVTGISGTPPSGTYTARVAAVNSCGSRTSRDAVLTVGPAVPARPVALASTVVGTTVTLTWLPSSIGPVAASFVVEAGATAGQTLVTLPTGAATLTVQNVPAGTYVVRIRGVNAAGIGAASEEVTVVVP